MPLKRRLATAAVIILGCAWEYWRTKQITGLEILVVVSLIAAAICSHKPRPFWFLMGIGLGAVLAAILIKLRW